MTLATTRKTLAWAHGSLSVQSLGGMLGPVTFHLANGRSVSPLHVAPWGDDPKRETLPAMLQELRGEWPCVPFGSATACNLPEGWVRPGARHEDLEPPHGHSSHVHWDWGLCDNDHITLTCQYPEHHAIQSLRRTIVPDPKTAALDITLDIQARHTCRLPIGLHPTFRLPSRPGAVRIEPGYYRRVYSFPGDVEPGKALFAQNQSWSSLGHIETRRGTFVDATQVPLASETEDLLQLAGSDGHVSLHYVDEAFRVRLSWQKEHFPSLLLWYSNRGRTDYPWNGRHVALGMEPVASAFDLGSVASTSENPISTAGVPTSIAFQPHRLFTTRYRISVEPTGTG